MSAGPSVNEERGWALRGRAAEWAGDGILTAEGRRRIEAAVPFDWRVSGLMLRLVFFALTSVGIIAFYGLMKLMMLPAGIVTAVAAIACAEMLIGRRRFYRTGIESALWIGALFAIIFSLPSSGKPEAILVFVAAFAIAGFRLRIAVFGAIAACLLVIYVAVKTEVFWPAAAAGLALTLLASLALTRTWRRPSTDELFAFLAVMMPLAGYVGGKLADRSASHSDGHEAGIILVFLLAGAVLLEMALRGPHHALFIASALCLAAARFESRELVSFRLENELIVDGLALMALAFVLSRFLRHRTTGLVATSTADRLELVRLVTTVALAQAQQPSAPAPDSQVESGGGRFGGAGATGDY
jgi:hypothetical protein